MDTTCQQVVIRKSELLKIVKDYLSSNGILNKNSSSNSNSNSDNLVIRPPGPRGLTGPRGPQGDPGPQGDGLEYFQTKLFKLYSKKLDKVNRK